MGQWEPNTGKSDEWYTPKYVFDALGVQFDLDAAAPGRGPRYTPTTRWLCHGSLSKSWDGFVWLNPHFGGRNGLVPWLDKFFAHGNGVCLTPDRSSAPWWQSAALRADALLMVAGKIRFERPDGSVGVSPANGTTLFASGAAGVQAIRNAAKEKLGVLLIKGDLT